MGKHPLPTQTGATPGTEQKSITGLQRWHSCFSCFSQNRVWSSGPALSADDCLRLCVKLWHALSGHASAFPPSPLPLSQPG